MATARLSGALVVLRAEVDAAHPKRDRSSDGWIGDRAHQLTNSQHNPDADGTVDALDTDTSGIDLPRMRACVIADPRTRLFISNRVIYSRTYGMAPRVYTGSNPHDKHCHTEVYDSADTDRRPWGYYTGGPVVAVPAAAGAAGGMTRLPVLRRNAAVWSAAVVLLQRALVKLGHRPGKVDGKFGDNTFAAVRRFQASGDGLAADGEVGTRTWAALAQALLRVAGADPGDIDGQFGPKTGAAAERFQRARGLTADRIIGPKTWTALLG